MIRAHMATYPKRRDVLVRALRSIASQVDQVFLVLNEYDEIPVELASIANVHPILPETDLKDTGKFLPRPAADDVVVLADDDLLYDPNHVRHLMREGDKLGLDRHVVGLHGTIYRSPTSRKLFQFKHALGRTRKVHQLGTGTLLALGRNVAPLDVMADSRKFVDVRYARWLAARGIGCWVVARQEGFLREAPSVQGQRESIYRSFTRTAPEPLLAEIRALIETLPVYEGLPLPTHGLPGDVQ